MPPNVIYQIVSVFRFLFPVRKLYVHEFEINFTTSSFFWLRSKRFSSFNQGGRSAIGRPD